MKRILENPSSISEVGFFSRLRQTRRCIKRIHSEKCDESKIDSTLPMVSVMLITYNHEKYIEQAMSSILAQECDFDIEINVIDDCSTDNTQSIVEAYQKQYPEIINCYFNQQNVGHIATQLNTFRGFQTLRGKYFCILEGDDFWTSPEKLKKQVGFLEENQEYAACAHDTLKVFEDGREPEHFLPFKSFGRNRVSMFDLVTMAGAFHVSSIVYRNKFGLNPPQCLADPYSCEITVNMVYGQFGDFFCLNEYMSAYRVHGGGTFSSRSLEEHWLFHLHGYQRFFMYLGHRYWMMFARAVVGFSKYVLTAYKKGVCDKLKHSSTLTFMIHYFVASLMVGVNCFSKFRLLKTDKARFKQLFVLNSVRLYYAIATRIPKPVRQLLRPIKRLLVNKFHAVKSSKR
ncbi:glycosyltransferase family 2 protein [uncultured Pseudodesulfovibrio sp.]|uniref:glycosyltransferase family 2 protein n=1 Tax=uncultured Pseudodesulfovibrio sp. TaxID=2035858 RepID=UPI0029C856EF|nr:glycosyltransferase family 2 protein [uncultured Pseudodesulfovibrio sp.]